MNERGGAQFGGSGSWPTGRLSGPNVSCCGPFSLTLLRNVNLAPLAWPTGNGLDVSWRKSKMLGCTKVRGIRTVYTIWAELKKTSRKWQ